MANLQVFRPVKDLFKVSDELDRFMWGLNRLEGEEETPAGWYPAVDIAEDKESLTLHAELPGLKREEVKINVRDGVLTLRGERKFEEERKKDNYYRIERSYGMFSRSFTLPRTAYWRLRSLRSGRRKIARSRLKCTKEVFLNQPMHPSQRVPDFWNPFLLI